MIFISLVKSSPRIAHARGITDATSSHRCFSQPTARIYADGFMHTDEVRTLALNGESLDVGECI